MIGIDNVPPDLRIEQVLGTEWRAPTDPRVAQMHSEASAPAQQLAS